MEGLTDEQVIVLFQAARKSDYEKIIQEANELLIRWSSGEDASQDPVARSVAQVSKLRRRLEEIAAIDFFPTPERGTAEMLIEDLAFRMSGQASAATTIREGLDNLKGKTWVTRENLFVDRIACGWLIRRFVDKAAVFKFVEGTQYTPTPGELRFDMFGGEYTHEGDRCTFEVMIQRLQINDRALAHLAEIVHDIDLKDDKYVRSETDGLNALLSGLVASQRDDDRRMKEGYHLFDNLYTHFCGEKGSKTQTEKKSKKKQGR